MRAVARTKIEELLADVPRRLTRLDPAQARRAMQAGAALIDIRSDPQIARDGITVGALANPRNALQWRPDPASQPRHPRAPQLDDQVIMRRDEGLSVQPGGGDIAPTGFAHATDVDGSFQAWRAAGLPVEQPSPPGKRHRRHRAIVQRTVLPAQPMALPATLNRSEPRARTTSGTGVDHHGPAVGHLAAARAAPGR